MKTKGIIKLINSINDLFKSAIELEKKQIERLVLTPKPIPDYKKGSVNKSEMIADSKKYQEHILDNPKAKDEARSHLVDAFKIAFQKGNIKLPDNKQNETLLNEVKNVFYEGGFRSGRTHFYEEWSKQLNEYLKGKGFKNDEPFGMAPIDNKIGTYPLGFVFKIDGVPVDVDVERKGNTFTIKDKKPIAPPLGFNHDFHKQAIEAEKELDKVCKEKPKLKQGTSTCSHELVVTRISEYQTEKVIYSKTSCQKCGKEFE